MERNGSLHVLRLGVDPLIGEERYAITYTPYQRRGGALPAREARGLSELREFLSDIKCDEGTIDRFLAEVKQTNRASLPNVVLSDEQLRHYGLQEMSVLRSVLSYLSS